MARHAVIQTAYSRGAATASTHCTTAHHPIYVYPEYGIRGGYKGHAPHIITHPPDAWEDHVLGGMHESNTHVLHPVVREATV